MIQSPVLSKLRVSGVEEQRRGPDSMSPWLPNQHPKPRKRSPSPRPNTYSLLGSSFLGLPFGILNIDLVKPKKGTTMETIGRTLNAEPWRRPTLASPQRADPKLQKLPSLCVLGTFAGSYTMGLGFRV